MAELTKAEQLKGLAWQYLRLNRPEDAFRCMLASLEFDPENYERHCQYVTALYEAGEYPLAMDMFNRWLRVQETLAARTGLAGLGVRILRGDWAANIGHIALLDLQVKLNTLGLMPPRVPIVSIPAPLVSNPCYLEYWRSYLPNIVTREDQVDILWHGGFPLTEHSTMLKHADGTFHPLHETALLAERLWEAQGRGPLLTLTGADEDRGRACLAALGVPQDTWFVGLHVREGGGRNRQGHNADIQTYLPAMAEIVRRGGWVLRVGDPSMTPLPPMPGIIDYALGPHRTDWMDVFIWAKSRFFVGTTSGPIGVPPTFGVPCVQTNWCPSAFRHWYRRDLCIPKLFRRIQDATWVDFPQVLSSSLGFATSLDHFQSQGVAIVDNTPDEITAVTQEMMDLLDGKLTYTAEDEALQSQYNAIRPRGPYELPATNRIGRAFLDKHRGLLGAVMA